MQDILHRLTSRRKIKAWPRNERPREKLLLHGPASLTATELLAILIRVGTGGCSALELAGKIMDDAETLRSLASRNPEELMRMKGIGQAKAVELVAAFEIGRRVEGEPQNERTVLRSPAEVAALMIPRLRDANNERFHVLVLDSSNGLVRDIQLTSGTLNASLVHPREVFKAAIDNRAAAVIVVHNHPSGNPEPSREDIEVTKQLLEAGKIIGIPLHDHVVIAGNRHTSLAERGFC